MWVQKFFKILIVVKFCHYPLQISYTLYFGLNIYIYYIVILTLPEYTRKRYGFSFQIFLDSFENH